MQEITPVGIIALDAQASLSFYRKVMGIARVQKLSSDASGEFGGTLLRLESPDIEINACETRICDRPGAAGVQSNRRLKYWCDDLKELTSRLNQQRTPVFCNGNQLSFLDPNGVNWDIGTRPPARTAA